MSVETLAASNSLSSAIVHIVMGAGTSAKEAARLLLQIPSRPDELHQRTDVTPICRFQRGDVREPPLVHFLKIVSARPIDGLLTIDAVERRIGHDAGVPAVSVRKRMDVDE